MTAVLGRLPVATRRTAALTGARMVIAAGLVSAGAVLWRATGHPGSPALWAVLLAAATVAAVLWLVRDQLDRAVTALVLGDSGDSYAAAQHLLHQMAGTLPVDDVVPRLAEAAGRVGGGPSAEVRLWLSDGAEWSQTWPPRAVPAGDAESVAVAVTHHGTGIGRIAVAVEAGSTVDRRLLEGLAGPAGLALSTVRLTYDLRRRRADLAALADALTASRDRLLTARRDEQQRLTAEVQARVAQTVQTAVVAVDAGDLAGAHRATGAALDALRDISRGIFPPRLGESGLAAALDGWLERADRFATIAVDDPAGRLDSAPAVAVCLYFCAVTVLGAWADAEQMAIAIAVDPGTARLILTGRGPAVPDPVRSVVQDRVDAFAGTVSFGELIVVDLPLVDPGPAAEVDG